MDQDTSPQSKIRRGMKKIRIFRVFGAKSPPQDDPSRQTFANGGRTSLENRKQDIAAPQNVPENTLQENNAAPVAQEDPIVARERPANAVASVQEHPDSTLEIQSEAQNASEFRTTTRRDLADEIEDVMKDIEDGRSRRYLPENSFATLITRPRIRQTLPNAPEVLIDFISTKARRVFVVTILSIGPNESDRISAMEAFRQHELHDGSLPIQKLKGEENLSIDCPQSCRDVVLSAFNHHPWGSRYRRNFYEHQWELLLPKLTMVKFEDFEPDRILPITDKKPIEGVGGHFSEVFSAKLLADYLADNEDGFQAKGQLINVAIKEMRNILDDPNYNVAEEWKKEAEAMKEINKMRHPNITYALAAFTYSSKHYLVLEWADGGNLRDFWERNESLQLTEAHVEELILQLWGLADAMEKIHNSKAPIVKRTRTESGLGDNGTSSTTPQIQVHAPNDDNEEAHSEVIVNDEYLSSDSKIPSITVDGSLDNVAGPAPTGSADDPNWRHGDLKPDNILVFRDDSWIGTLKLADLGRARKHQFGTFVRNVMTDEKFSTKQYEPPEAHTNSGARSRRWDMWSMGCIMFESILWLLYGTKGQRAFTRQQTPDTPVGTVYWTEESTAGKTAKVNELTTSCMDFMVANDPECRPGSAIGDLLILIREKLLVVNLPRYQGDPARCRADAKTLLEDITRIKKKAVKSGYLFTGADRTNIQAPTFSQEISQLSSSGTIANGSIAPKFGRKLSTPSVGQPLGVPVQNQTFRNIWEYLQDDVFANQVLQQKRLDIESLIPNEVSGLCQDCLDLDFYASPLKISVKLVDLQARSIQGCRLCRLLLNTANRFGIPGRDSVDFDKSNSGLRINGGGPPVLSICRTVEVPGLTTLGPSYIRMGLPRLPATGSSAQFQLLREWLVDCDNNHSKSCALPKQVTVAIPTRLIDVGSEPDASTICLVDKNSLDSGNLRYVAFSHPWGKKKDGHEHFIAEKGIRDEVIGSVIAVKDLPNTFRDAIRVTRGLGIRYLWIDSLCILQGPTGDFDVESKLMDTVFHSAYCVIAAASAQGTSSEIIAERLPRDVVTLEAKKNGVQHSLYIQEALDNFQGDVLDGPLSKRGWVLQERALARRTIFFTGNQTYWECGHGIRCETLTKMRNSEVAFLGDPNFPKYALESTKGGQIFLYESLYEQYSRLDFSYPADRSVAILGLEQRLTRAFNDEGQHGVFQRHLERGLLWQRGTNEADVKKLIKIQQQATGHDRGRRSPTWSWMAYEGGITFMSPKGGWVDWGRKVSWLTGEDGKLKLKGFARDFDIPTGTDESKANIVYDEGSSPENVPLKCVVFGVFKDRNVVATKRHYVLVVCEKKAVDGSISYERVGVGFLPGSFIKEEELEVLIL